MCFWEHQWTATGMGFIYCANCGTTPSEVKKLAPLPSREGFWDRALPHLKIAMQNTRGKKLGSR